MLLVGSKKILQNLMRKILPLIILLFFYACKKDYSVPEGIGRISVCKITNPKKDLLWIDEKIQNTFKVYKTIGYKYISATLKVSWTKTTLIIIRQMAFLKAEMKNK